MKPNRGFTVVELVIALTVIAVAVAIALPTLAKFRRSANAAACLNNMRSLGQAHWLYMNDYDGRFIDVGLPHGGLPNEDVAWINTLKELYDNALALRSPADDSPHWPTEIGQGVPVPGTSGRFRRTSYGCNNYLTSLAPIAPALDVRADRLSRVPAPADTVHFLIMAYTGSYAGADHVHVEHWWNQAAGPDFPPVVAASQMQTNAHGGQARSWEARSNYAFLDGHVEIARFIDVYQNRDTANRFDPQVAKRFASLRSNS